MNELLNWILDAVQSVDPVLRTLIAGLGILLETSVLVGLIIPGDTIVIVASTAIENPVQYLAMTLTVIAGSLAGESIGFALGRFFGPRIRRSRLGRRIGDHNWGRAERYLDRRGGPAVFLSRFIPVLHSLIPLTVGMSAMTYRRFLAWTAPACVIWTFGYVTVGWLAADRYRELARELHWAGYLFVGAILLFLVLAWLAKRLILRGERHHMQGEEGDAGSAAEPADGSSVDTARAEAGPGPIASGPVAGAAGRGAGEPSLEP